VTRADERELVRRASEDEGAAETSSCYFENVRWIFEGAAGTIVHVMQGLG
jgi:hypothetical protein